MARLPTTQGACTNPIRPNQTQPANKMRLIALILLALLVLVGLIILITWLALKPKKVQFSIDEAWIKDYNLDPNGKLNSTFNFVIRADNPNKKSSMYYDSMKVKVYYRGQAVASDTVDPFHQPRKNVTRFLVHGSAQNVQLLGRAVHDLKVERTGGEVDLDVEINGKIKVKVGAWKSRKYKLKILCSPVVVNFSNHTRFRRAHCEVDD